MEDEKQHVRDLFKKLYSSEQALDDALDAFEDLSGKDRRALTAEFLSSPLGKDFENLSRQIAQALEKLRPQFEALRKLDYKEALVRLSRRIPYECGRNKKKVKDDLRKQALDDAIVAVAEDKVLAASIEFANALRPAVYRILGLESDDAAKIREGFGLQPDNITWPSAALIKLAIRRLKNRLKPAKTNRVSPTSAKTNRVSR